MLDPLSGYLTLIQSGKSGAYNFGPDPANRRTVGELIERFAALSGDKPNVTLENAPMPEEAPYLSLSSEKAARELAWRPEMDFARAVDATAKWYADWRAGADPAALVRAEIAAYAD